MIPISNFKQNPDNPRTIKKEQLEKLKRSIKEMGFKEVPETWVALADEWTEEQLIVDRMKKIDSNLIIKKNGKVI